ncbi:MAG: hypothetical protein AB8C46_15905 [Burkholderiaceae bacterium]
MRSEQKPSKIAALALYSALTSIAVSSAIAPATAHAQSSVHDASMASGMSAAIPVAVSIAAPAALSAGVTVLTVESVKLGARGVTWIVTSAATGVSTAITFATDSAHAFTVGAGTVLSTAITGAGVLLYHGSQAVAFIPNQAGEALSHHEQLTR